jgi:hypothetical protein
MNNDIPSDTSIINWMEANPEAIRTDSWRKSCGRIVKWIAPDGRRFDTLRECVAQCIIDFPVSK